MPRFTIVIERVVREIDFQDIDAATLSEAFKAAHAAYCHGPTEGRPYSYDWEDAGVVESIEFQHRDALHRTRERASFDQAEVGKFDPPDGGEKFH